MTGKMFNNILTALIVIALIALITVLSYRFLVHDSRLKPSDNPYAFDISKYKTIPPEWIHYHEIMSIPVKLPKAISIDQHDQLYIVSGTNIIRYSPEWTESGRFAIAAGAHCIAIGPDNRILTGFDNTVDIFNESGNPLQRMEIGNSHSFITSLAISDSFVYVADMGQRIILKYDRDGGLKGQIGKRDESRDIPGFVVPSPYFDIALDSDGFLWAANPGLTRLENYTPNGDLRAFWGESSIELDGFSGCCNPAHFCLLSDGSFVTAEKGLARIKVYDRAGQLVSVVAGPEQFRSDTAAMDLAADSHDRIYVADTHSNAVRVFEHNED